MKRRYSADTGFWLAFVINLVFQGEWLLAAFLMLVLHHIFDTPMLLVWAAVGIWVLWAFIVTVVLSWAAGTGNELDANAPKGQRTSERLKQQKREEEKQK